MKKFTPILILILIVGVISVSGCITILDDNNPADNLNNNSDISTKTDIKQSVVNVNKSGNIEVGTENTSKKVKDDNRNNQNNQQPKISKEEIEKEVIRILKLDNPELNFTSNATLIHAENTPYYIVDVYDDYGWYGYFEINANVGPKGNDKDGYSFDGGAVRGETGDEPTPIKGVMPISVNEARQLIDKELKANYSVNNPYYSVEGFIENNTLYYNITIEELNENNVDTTPIGFAIMDANTGKIISVSLEKDVNNKEKIYSVDEAGAYVDIIYKGKHVSVRENYPYYSPQNDKIYYSQEEEAEDLIKYYEDFN